MHPNSIQPALEHFGIAAAAVGGVLAASGKRIDLFGTIVLALVTAFGGGTTRDLLANNLPPIWLRDSSYLLNVIFCAVGTFFLARTYTVPRTVLLVTDAFALALFTMIGTQMGVEFKFAPLIAILLGVATGVAGGILRDLLTGEVPLVFQPEIHLYATAAICGAAAYVILKQTGIADPVSTMAGGAIVLGLRLGGIKWGLSLPVFESRDGTPKVRKTF